VRPAYAATKDLRPADDDDPQATLDCNIQLDQPKPRSQRMCDDNDQTKSSPPAFDFSAFPYNTLFHERRNGPRRRKDDAPTPEMEQPTAPVLPSERRVKKERRRRIDPTTFEKQYTSDEMEFMNAMQRFKESSGKSFPSHGEVIKVAVALGYRRVIDELDPSLDESFDDDPCLAESSTIDAVELSL
jgi:hypothetical protein